MDILNVFSAAPLLYNTVSHNIYILAGGDEESAETKALKEQVSKLEKDLASANKNVESMKSQSESLAQEYDR